MLLRAGSTATTARLGNPVVSTAELGGSIALALLALAVPFAAAAVAIVLLWLGVRTARRVLRRRAGGATDS